MVSLNISRDLLKWSLVAIRFLGVLIIACFLHIVHKSPGYRWETLVDKGAGSAGLERVDDMLVFQSPTSGLNSRSLSRLCYSRTAVAGEPFGRLVKDSRANMLRAS
jgi:hypothetical protein